MCCVAYVLCCCLCDVMLLCVDVSVLCDLRLLPNKLPLNAMARGGGGRRRREETDVETTRQHETYLHHTTARVDVTTDMHVRDSTAHPMHVQSARQCNAHAMDVRPRHHDAV